MAFTTWSALRADILNKLAEHIAGEPMVGEYEIGDRRMKYNSPESLMDLYRKTFELESLEMQSSVSSGFVTYGRHRRFR